MLLFSLQSQFPISNFNIELKTFGIQEKDSNHSFGPILRNEYILQYMIDGKGSFEMNGITYMLKKGDLFCIQKKVLHKYWANKEDPYSYYYIDIDGQDLDKILTEVGFSKDNAVINYSDDRIVEIYKKIQNALLSKNMSGYLLAKAHAIELISFLMNYGKNKKLQQIDIGVEYVEKAKNFIYENYNNDITVERLAREVGLCRNYFCTVFKKHTGTSPKEYLLNYRINQAKTMLLQNINVTETAILSGFNSISNFSFQFKNITGLSPYEYKKKQTKNRFI